MTARVAILFLLPLLGGELCLAEEPYDEVAILNSLAPYKPLLIYSRGWGAKPEPGIGPRVYGIVIWSREFQARNNVDITKQGNVLTDAIVVEMCRLKHVEWIDIAGDQITDDAAIELAQVPNLKSLSIAAPRLTRRGIEAIAKLKNLTSIQLGGSPVSDDDLEILVTGLKKLQVVSIARTAVTNQGVKKLQQLPELGELHMTGSQTDDDVVDALTKIPKLVYVTNFNLSDEAVEKLQRVRPDIGVKN